MMEGGPMAPWGIIFMSLVFVFAVIGVIATISFFMSRVRRHNRD